MEHHTTEDNTAAANKLSAQDKTIILAGATGRLGQKIAAHLLDAGATVKALVRKNSPDTPAWLQQERVIPIAIDYDNPSELAEACKGGACIVSALSGLEDVIIGIQTKLLHAGLKAGVPRFIPSDYCIDYTKLPPGNNRNLDLRRSFNAQIDKTAIAATSILNGMFTELLNGQAPVVLFKWKRVLYWGDSTQYLDFTTMDNTAEYTAHAALDEITPRYLRIAGDVVNAVELKNAATEVTGDTFHLLRAGRLRRLRSMIKITRLVMPGKEEVFPPWQGMQYLHDMFTGLPKLTPLNNDRYPRIKWTTVREVLAKRDQ